MPVPKVICETERLLIRPFNQHDIESLFLMNSNQEMLTYIPTKPFTELKQAQTLFDDVICADYRKHGFGRWAVHHKADNKVIGFCGPKYIPEFDKVEIGYRYFPEYWRKGIGFEAADAVLATCKPLHNLDEIIALILHGNEGSEAVARKVGMSILKQAEYFEHKVHVYHKNL
ncbi:GNAT family N-acetyltransferase [Shewanella sp. WXL01]|uniref:N-acetyltransferase n=1 Tax=Shewanella maritima TaxID=2520507 RepID=A0A411PLQ3_9GAMM|nr:MULTISPECIES: GNAT family N-acetyltransferase [Shewanella]NKF51641.1 GNAT family N-acetyltransferase [Shewanella sp. WXL01]QBF84445.1 N-acetyltransferase [Shewanella maritima]